MNEVEQKIAALEQKIIAIDSERALLSQELAELKHQYQCQKLARPAFEATITHQSSIKDKISLFRSLFKGREDIFPRRWDNSKTGKSGYSPMCANE